MKSELRKRVALNVILPVCVVGVVALVCAACRDEPSPNTSAAPSAPSVTLPAEYLGRWYFGGTSGGIEGGETATADGSWIVITADNTIEHYSADGHLGATEKFEPSRGPSIFSRGDAWLLGGAEPFARVIAVHPDGILTIADNVYDGFGSSYTRNR